MVELEIGKDSEKRSIPPGKYHVDDVIALVNGTRGVITDAEYDTNQDIWYYQVQFEGYNEAVKESDIEKKLYE